MVKKPRQAFMWSVEKMACSTTYASNMTLDNPTGLGGLAMSLEAVDFEDMDSLGLTHACCKAVMLRISLTDLLSHQRSLIRWAAKVQLPGWLETIKQV